MRYLTQGEKENSRRLYECCFPEDSQKFVDYYYQEKCRENEIAVIEENGKIILLDYKTDYVEQRDGSDLVGKYGIQLKYYQKALERMLEKPVEEKYIYSVNLERAFAVE